MHGNQDESVADAVVLNEDMINAEMVGAQGNGRVPLELDS